MPSEVALESLETEIADLSRELCVLYTAERVLCAEQQRLLSRICLTKKARDHRRLELSKISEAIRYLNDQRHAAFRHRNSLLMLRVRVAVSNSQEKQADAV